MKRRAGDSVPEEDNGEDFTEGHKGMLLKYPRLLFTAPVSLIAKSPKDHGGQRR